MDEHKPADEPLLQPCVLDYVLLSYDKQSYILERHYSNNRWRQGQGGTLLEGSQILFDDVITLLSTRHIGICHVNVWPPWCNICAENCWYKVTSKSVVGFQLAV